MAKPKPSKSLQIPAAINPDGVKPVYVNNMELQMNGFEARLMFNEIIPNGQGVLTVERRASVVMPLVHFRALAAVLHANVPKAIKAAQDAESSLVPANDAPKE